MTTRTETALSKEDLAAIERADADEWPMIQSIIEDRRSHAPSLPDDPRLRAAEQRHTLLAALTAERAARGRVEAAAREVVGAIDDGFADLAIRIPNPGQRRRIVSASAALRAALAPSTTTPEADSE